MRAMQVIEGCILRLHDKIGDQWDKWGRVSSTDKRVCVRAQAATEMACARADAKARA
jgi:hypothetical protein